MFENVMKLGGTTNGTGQGGKLIRPKNQVAKKAVVKKRAVTPSRNFEFQQESKHKQLCEQIPRVFGSDLQRASSAR